MFRLSSDAAEAAAVVLRSPLGEQAAGQMKHGETRLKVHVRRAGRWFRLPNTQDTGSGWLQVRLEEVPRSSLGKTMTAPLRRFVTTKESVV